MDNFNSREELEHAAMQAIEKQEQEAEKEPYVPRTRGIRILAWTLVALILIGVAHYYFWNATAGTL